MLSMHILSKRGMLSMYLWSKRYALYVPMVKEVSYQCTIQVGQTGLHFLSGTPISSALFIIPSLLYTKPAEIKPQSYAGKQCQLEFIQEINGAQSPPSCGDFVVKWFLTTFAIFGIRHFLDKFPAANLSRKFNDGYFGL